MNNKCKSCSWYDREDKFCYYYLLSDTDLFEIEKRKCNHWKKRRSK